MDKNTVALGLIFTIGALTGYVLSLGHDGMLYASGLSACVMIGSWVFGVDYGKRKAVIKEAETREG